MPDSQMADGGQHLADDFIPLAEAVMERNGHAVLKACGFYCLLDRREHFAVSGNMLSGCP